ncbi:dipeptidyl aminopeptidase [Paenibacillus mesophilus]|uniref:alpha/beta hydrolase family protein n=1 Tax=Paenibacillus mesophilus TaxID=2582849 RepID=UPI00110F5FB1|nr:prolyl oligopeptidase family serine peptidase [Paenibacillus mesophilus]TMV43751.1 dipeptidyl aminopeptidase [Paenibacillus mesophilus]
MSYNLFELNQKGLPHLLDGVNDANDWLTKRNEIKHKWLEFIGGLPERVPVSYKVLDEIKEQDHTRLHLIYDTVYGDQVTAYLLIPDPSIPGKDQYGRRPAMLALHGTQELGKEHYATLSGGENRRYGLQLVSRGYIVLVPDALTAGERIYDGCRSFQSKPFYEKHPNWTTVGKNIVDHMQGVDLLSVWEGVDPNRIGVIGLSFGGYNSYFLAGIDERIRAVVSICGFSPFYGDHRPTHWGIRSWYTHLPKITDYLSRYEVPFEFHEIAMLTAPVPIFYYYGQTDAIFPHWQAIGECMAELYKLYQFLEVGDRFEAVMTAKAHDFPPEIRTMAYDFLNRWLMEPSK